MTTHAGLELTGASEPGFDEVLTPDALEFVAELQRQFGRTRNELLEARARRRERLRAGETLDFLPDTKEIREGEWQVARVPADMQQRWVEITGPTERKMAINALNSGADGFMADFEDANAPTWRNMVEGHINLRDAIDGTITYEGSDGRHYELGEHPATLLVRPRGWHLPERHLLVDSEPIAGRVLRFRPVLLPLLRDGCLPGDRARTSTCRRWSRTSRRGCGTTSSASPQDALGVERGAIKATVLIETLPAAFEMEEILYELREHSAGLNAGRWDYIFSVDQVLPRPPRDGATRSQCGDDDRAVHARVHRTACGHLPPSGCPCDGRDGRVDPVSQGRGGQREGARRRPRRQGARGRAGLRRHLGCAPRSRSGRPGCVRDGSERRRKPTRAPARRRQRQREPTCSISPPRRARSPRLGCAPTSASASSTSRSGWAAVVPPRSTR